jgi:hypothetical protein
VDVRSHAEQMISRYMSRTPPTPQGCTLHCILRPRGLYYTAHSELMIVKLSYEALMPSFSMSLRTRRLVPPCLSLCELGFSDYIDHTLPSRFPVLHPLPYPLRFRPSPLPSCTSRLPAYVTQANALQWVCSHACGLLSDARTGSELQDLPNGYVFSDAPPSYCII